MAELRQTRNNITATGAGGIEIERNSRLSIVSHDITPEIPEPRWTELISSLTPEALSTSTWVISSCTLRALLSLLRDLASFQEKKLALSQQCQTNNVTIALECAKNVGVSARIWEEIIGTLSVFASWFLSLFPEKVTKGLAPGFIFASTWMLFPIRDHFGPIPNVPTRICEMVLGRITRRDLALILPVHFLIAVFGSLFLRILLPSQFSSRFVDPIVYSEENPFLIDLIREILINAIFTTSMLVVPEILKLNNIPKVFLPLFILPVYLFSVDSTGTASMFGPDALYALSCVSEKQDVPLRQSPHVLGPLIGGLLGGKIMAVFFPDEPRY